ncbi:rano class II histocompatibility antigen, A beta chain-like [Denticeps clupeoides]|uniref:Ig-like domain-containing protein n=1 Tax=Denticeps clupeoides TaxID=299321 RepID=A0AAY4CXK8_9TELE|nr:rano class II histocompatibility antigen, A beta chain-like [Denticeps clupeoides]
MRREKSVVKVKEGKRTGTYSGPVNMSAPLYTVLLLFSGLYTTDAYYYLRHSQCLSSSADYGDMLYKDAFIFNKIRFIFFNSSGNMFGGYTSFGLRVAEDWNRDISGFLSREREGVENFCKTSAREFSTHVLDQTVEPEVRMRLLKSSSGKHPAILVCSAYDFYPKLIKLTWLRDGEEVTSDVSSTEEMPDGDWYYQIHSYLEFTPNPGEKISCVVEHTSFKLPQEYIWDFSHLESDRNKMAIGASALVLGVVVAGAGVLYYRKKCQGWILVPPR